MDVSDYADAASDELLETTLEDVRHAVAERREYELRGAWRAGYRYVHRFGPGHRLAHLPLGHIATDRLVPSDESTPPFSEVPPGYEYRYTYDLTSVPDDVIRAAIAGELDPKEWER